MLLNCTIVNGGTGMDNVSGSAPIIFNSIIFGNTKIMVNDISSKPNIVHSLVQGFDDPEPFRNNIPGAVNPLFVDIAGGDFRLQACSPLINRGYNLLYSNPSIDLSMITTDQGGSERFYNQGTVDIGAYEYQGDVSVGAAGIWYVKESVLGSGKSWDCATADLQSVIDMAAFGDQNWVAGGTYIASLDPSVSKSFKMKAGVKIYGGFAGTETSLADRNLSSNNRSILTVSSPYANHYIIENIDNGLTREAVLDGFTIFPYSQTPGGIKNSNSSPRFVNLVLTGGVSANYAAMRNDNASPSIINCSITDLTGYGIYNSASSPEIINCTIAKIFGLQGSPKAAMLNTARSSPKIRNTIIFGNEAGVISESGSFTQAMYSLVQGLTNNNENGNISGDANPMFVSLAGGNYQLQLCSPALNGGNNFLYPADDGIDTPFAGKDLIGNNRIYNDGIIDMGAYEYQGNRSVSVAGVKYVRSGATSSGVSWDCADGDLQTAINTSLSGQQIWVAGGTLQPRGGTSFQMKEGVQIFGGFAGTETAFSQRDLSVSANETILDGNGRSVVINNALSEAAILDGFTITGSTSSAAIQNGSGSSASFTNLIVKGNQQSGMSISGSSPTLTNCSFTGNTTSTTGGGVMVSARATPIFIKCTITGNSAGNGGGIYISNASLTLLNSLISGNNATSGAGISSDMASTLLINVTIARNTAQGNGGAVYNNNSSSLILLNSIVALNNTGIVSAGNSTIQDFYSLVQPTESTDPEPDPLFANADAGDFRLQPCSPAINQAFNYYQPNEITDLSEFATDLDNNPRVAESAVDMGAYEFSGASRELAADGDQGGGNIPGNLLLTTSTESDCKLLAYLSPNGAAPVEGAVTAKVWVANAQPKNFVKRYYQITPENNLDLATARVTLYFTQQEFDEFNAVNATKLPLNAADAEGYKANLRIEKRSGVSSNGSGLPSSYTGSIATFTPSDANGKVEWNATAQYWEVSFDVTGFSGFFVKTVEPALPLNLISFTATKETTSNLLQWSTTSEVNTSSFEIESSVNAKNFIKIGTINANGSGNHTYRFTDQNQYGATVYYRLKMFDRAANGLDGSFTYSKIVSLTGDASFAATYPNPATTTITFQVNNTLLKSTAILYDISGRKLHSILITNNRQEINVKSLLPGVYFIRFADGTAGRFVKQ
jgi:hypothetical protein